MNELIFESAIWMLTHWWVFAIVGLAVITLTETPED